MRNQLAASSVESTELLELTEIEAITNDLTLEELKAIGDEGCVLTSSSETCHAKLQVISGKTRNLQSSIEEGRSSDGPSLTPVKTRALQINRRTSFLKRQHCQANSGQKLEAEEKQRVSKSSTKTVTLRKKQRNGGNLCEAGMSKFDFLDRGHSPARTIFDPSANPRCDRVRCESASPELRT